MLTKVFIADSVFAYIAINILGLDTLLMLFYPDFGRWLTKKFLALKLVHSMPKYSSI